MDTIPVLGTTRLTEDDVRQAIEEELRATLQARMRAALWLATLWLICFAAYDVAGDPSRRDALLSLHLLRGIVVLAAFPLVSRAATLRRTVALGVGVVTALSVGMVAVNVVRGDTAIPPMFTTGILMATATLLPWGWRAQVQVAVAATAAMVAVSWVVTGPASVFHPVILTSVLVAVASVWVAAEVERSRYDAARRERLRARLAVEEVVRGISTSLIQLRGGEIEVGIASALRRLGQFADVDRSYLFVFGPDGRRASQVDQWCAEGAPPLADVGGDGPFSDFTVRLLSRLEVVHVPRVADLPSEAASERAFLETQGTRSILLVPVVMDGSLGGVLGFDAVRSERRWSNEAIALLSIAADVFAALLARRQAEARATAARRRAENEARTSAALARVGREMIALVDAPAIARRVSELGRELLGCEASVTLLWDAGRDTYVVAWPPRDDGVLEIGRARLAPLLAFLGPHDLAQMSLPVAPGLVPAELELPAEPGLVIWVALRRGGDFTGIQAMVAPGRIEPVGSDDERIARGLAHIASLALTNARLVEELERANRLKSEFVSTMSHELRTPINVILGYADMVTDAQFDAEAREAIVERIRLAGGDLLDLVESTLDISRLELGRDEVRRERVHVPEFWLRLAERCARIPHRDAVRLDWQAGVPDASLETDPRKVRVMVTNLVSNALKFTERGSVRVALALDDDTFTVRVEDTGIGISRADQRVIFDVFRQADSSDTRRYGGTGLGLFIVQRYAEQLGGDVTVDSAPGQGSVFSVRLPVGPPSKSPAQASMPSLSTTRG
jgi:signal transduction histidine kinase